MIDPTNNQPQAMPDPDAQPPMEPKRRKKSLWVRLIKWTLISIVALLLLIAGCISLVVWTLTPDRLTPIINKYASEYLIADVDAKRVELTFWSTFPHLSVQVDSLQVNSRALHSLPDSVRSTLPADADSLLFLKKFAGGLNITSLIAGNIELYNVDFHDIRANLVQVDSLAANYLIVPPSEETDSVKTDTGLPSIALDRFLIADGMSARFRNITDSLDCTLKLKQLNLTDLKQSKPLYSFTTEGDASAAMPWLKVPATPFSINGKIAWESSAPMVIGLSDFSLGVGDVIANFTTSIDMSTDFIIKEFSANVPRVQLSKVLAVVPDQFKAPLKPLDTDLNLEMSAKILKPYNLASKELPVIDASIRTDAKHLKFDKLQLSLLELDADAHIDCNKPDASVIDIKRVAARGRAIDFSLSALVTTPVSDPNIEGTFDGTVTFQNLPSQLLSSLPCAIRGSLHGTARVITRLSYLEPKKFHRAKIDGTLTLDNFHMAMTDGSLDAFLNRAEFKLGSSSQITVQDHVVDSMLTASLTIDTIALSSPGVVLSGSKLAANVGSRNIASSSDTSQINPIGANITAARLLLKSDSDSVRLRLRDAQIAASLQRYESQARSPLLKSLVKARSMRFADRFNRLSLREAEADFTAHPKARPQMSARRQAIFDSIAAAHPELSTDSIRGLMRAGFKKRMQAYDDQRKGREDIHIDIDNSIHSILRQWNAHGTLKAKRARLFTPYFPSRNSLSNLDLSFSTDSVVLRDTKLKMNRSDFLLNGSVRNITRALMSRHGSPFELDFSVKSDTIDINDLTATMLRGAMFADRISSGTMQAIASGNDDDSDDELQRTLDNQLPDSSRAAVLIPSNINGRFSLKASHVLYADLWLHGLDGLVEVYDGALNLDRLRAYTSIGAVNFTALYSAPTIDDLSLAAAVRIRRLNLRSVLDMMPEIDSLLPLLGEVRGIVDADLALTTRLDSMMNLDIPSLNLALKISGDSLQLLDNETFNTIAKWMLFKKKQRNMIDRMDVELAIHDGYIDLYPFIFNMDRYRLGVRGSNDAALNLNYHVAVIKSPIPFKFGINIKGTPDNMKIRLGKAKINEKTVAESRQITDTVRVNLIKEISNVFRRGVRATGSRGLKLQDTRSPGSGAVNNGKNAPQTDDDDKFSHADSVTMIEQGLIKRPPGFIMPSDSLPTDGATDKPKKKKSKK